MKLPPQSEPSGEGYTAKSVEIVIPEQEGRRCVVFTFNSGIRAYHWFNDNWTLEHYIGILEGFLTGKAPLLELPSAESKTRSTCYTRHAIEVELLYLMEATVTAAPAQPRMGGSKIMVPRL